MRLLLREWTVVAISSLVSCALIGVNAWYQRHQTLRIATVDARAVLQAKHKQVSELLLKQDLPPDVRRSALESAAAYPARFDEAVQSVMHGCRCVLVSKDLVVAGTGVEDYTAEVLERLQSGLDR